MVEHIYSMCSEKYHPKVREVMAVLPTSQSFNVRKVGTTAELRNEMTKASKDLNGFIHLISSTFPLTNNVTTYPFFKVEGDFAMVLVKTRRIDPRTRQDFVTNDILVYERTQSMSKKLGGILECYATP